MLSGLENELALSDMQLYQEFDSSNFIANAKYAINGKMEGFTINMKMNYYSNILEKAIKSFSDVIIDESALKDFVSEGYYARVNGSGIVMRDIGYSMTSPFKPQYLRQYTEIIGGIMDKAIDGTITSSDIEKVVSGDIVIKVEKQVVNTTNLKYGSNAKDMVKNRNTRVVPVTTDYLTERVIPFIKNFVNLKQSTLAEAGAVLNGIRDMESTMRSMAQVVKKMRDNDPELSTGEKGLIINKIYYNAFRGMIDVVSFVTFLMIRKLNDLGSDVIACNKVYIDIMNLYVDKEIVESELPNSIIPTDGFSISNQLMTGRCDSLVTIANDIYSSHSTSDLELDKSDPHLCTAYDVKYDKDIYNRITKIYDRISASLDSIEINCQDYLVVFNDIIISANLSSSLIDRFSGVVEDIDNIKFYNEYYTETDRDDSLMKQSVLNELSAFSDNMTSITGTILSTYMRLSELSDRFNNNINGEFRDTETLKELIRFTENLKSEYKTLTTNIGFKLSSRLKKLNQLLTDLKKKNDEIKSEISNPDTQYMLNFNVFDEDYADSAYTSIIDSYEADMRLRMESLEQQYFVMKKLVLEGVSVILEADNQNTNNNTQNGNNSNSTTVTIQDNSTEASSSSNDGSKVTNIISSVGEWFRQTIDRFMEFIGKQGKQNLNWLHANKQALLNRSYNNVTINILPYSNIPSKTIIDNIKKLTNNVRAMTASNMATVKDENALYAKIFPFIRGGINNSSPLKDQFIKYYKVGSSPLETHPISNGQLKTVITSEMIPFCESYYGNYSNEIKAALEGLSTAVDNTIKSYNSQQVKESVSVFTEAQGTTTSGPTLADKSKWLQNVTKVFAGSILNALRDRNNDYFKVLSSLAPKAPVNPTEPKSNNNKNNNSVENSDTTV